MSKPEILVRLNADGNIRSVNVKGKATVHVPDVEKGPKSWSLHKLDELNVYSKGEPMPGERPNAKDIEGLIADSKHWCLLCNGTKRLMKRRRDAFMVDFVPCPECCGPDPADLYFTEWATQ